MARQNRSKRTKVRGNLPKAQFPAGLAEIVSETVRLWRKHHLSHVTPLLRKHINPFGRYYFDLNHIQQDPARKRDNP